jgi:hypothetical protein
MVYNLRGGFVAIISTLVLILLTTSSFAATTIMIESTEILPGTTSVALDFSIFDIDAADNIDSMTFDLGLSDGLVLTDVVFSNVPSGWGTISNTSLNRFGMTDGGWPPNTLTSDLVPAVELYFDIDPLLSVAGNSFAIDFAFYEIVDDNYSPVDLSSVAFVAGEISVVPIPSAVLLLCSGLVGLFAIRRVRQA